MSDFCYYLEKNRFDVNEIKNKKDRVFKKLLKIVKNVNFASITKEIVDNTFFILDEEYFDNKIYKRIKSTGSILKFNSHYFFFNYFSITYFIINFTS